MNLLKIHALSTEISHLFFEFAPANVCGMNELLRRGAITTHYSQIPVQLIVIKLFSYKAFTSSGTF